MATAWDALTTGGSSPGGDAPGNDTRHGDARGASARAHGYPDASERPDMATRGSRAATVGARVAAGRGFIGP